MHKPMAKQYEADQLDTLYFIFLCFVCVCVWVCGCGCGVALIKFLGGYGHARPLDGRALFFRFFSTFSGHFLGRHFC